MLATARISLVPVCTRWFIPEALPCDPAATAAGYPAQAFINQDGAVVVSFDSQAAAEEGDVGSYMQHLVDCGSIAEAYRCVPTTPASALNSTKGWPYMPGLSGGSRILCQLSN